jgi:hypothetical protein
MFTLQPERDAPPERQAAQATMIREGLSKQKLVNIFATEALAAQAEGSLRLPFPCRIEAAR